MDIFQYSVISWIGLCLGSFLHVAISRFSPSQTGICYIYRIGFHRSSCPNCNQNLGILSLIPVMSWVIQRGRCRYCQYQIPIHYLIMEVTIALYCVVIITIYGLSQSTLLLLFIGLYFILLSAIDMRYLLLPNYFTLPLLLAGLLTAYFKIIQISFHDALIGIVMGYFLLWLPATLHTFIIKKRGLGGGDIKLMAALGSWVHYTQLPILLIIASSIGVVYFLYLVSVTKANKKEIMIPFGPCLMIAAYAILLLNLTNETH